ncbi:MAG: hypothetical protein LBQ14_07810 [Treponema sp.]|jgi:hypothetical protein|nr:hypothetical protein [Treponema sp.]
MKDLPAPDMTGVIIERLKQADSNIRIICNRTEPEERELVKETLRHVNDALAVLKALRRGPGQRKKARQEEGAKSRREGWLSAIIGVCDFFIRRQRPDIAASLLEEFYLEREEFVKFHFDRFELRSMDKAGLFVNPKEGGTVRRCRVCGCTDDDCRQCVEKTGHPCHWVEEDLCSACADEA